MDILVQVWSHEICQTVLKKIVFNFLKLFSLFCDNLPLKKSRAHHLKNMKLHLIQGCFERSLVSIGSIILEENIFKCRQCILAISLSSLFGKGQDLSFEDTWIPFAQGCFLSSLVEIGLMLLEKKILHIRHIFGISF